MLSLAAGVLALAGLSAQPAEARHCFNPYAYNPYAYNRYAYNPYGFERNYYQAEWRPSWLARHRRCDDDDRDSYWGRNPYGTYNRAFFRR